jgi:tetratricopeptide (TPR) repeat protein
LLALILAERGLKDQALLELRIAADYAPMLADRAGALAVKLGQDPAWLHRVVPSGRNGAPVLFALATHLPDEQARAQDAFLEEATARDPDFVEAQSMLVERLLSAFENPDGSGRCTGADTERCAGVILAHCDALQRLQPDSPAPLVCKGRAYLDSGRPLLAAQKLSTQCQRFTDRIPCLDIWLEAAATAHDTKLAMQAAKQLELDGCAGQHLCASTYESIADAFHRAGDENGSLEYYEKAARREPAPERWRRAADAAAAISEALLTKGDLPRAIAYAERAARLDPQVARWRRVAELKEPPEERPPTSSAAQLPEEARDAIMRAHLLDKRAK